MRRPVDFRAVNLAFRSILSIALMYLEDTVQNETGEKFFKKTVHPRITCVHTELPFRKWGAPAGYDHR